MSFAARQFARTSLRTATRRVNASGLRTTGVRMGSSSSAHGAKASSDKPWIIASSLIFGPVFLYLLSPSAKKAQHHEHHHSASDHGHKEHTEPEPEPAQVVITDDEGTEANVTEEVKKAEQEDVPKAEPAADDATPPQEESSSSEEPSSPSTDTPATEETKEEPKEAATGASALQNTEESQPKDMGAAREAAKEGKPPKQTEGAEQ